MRFTKGKYAFLVATHTDREHIHNHIIYNSTALTAAVNSGLFAVGVGCAAAE